MSLANYFENVKGVGVLGTADPEGKVDLAIYARPHVIDEQTVAFIMRDRLSHRNVAANPHAAYLFLEDTEGYNGLRMHLTKTFEEADPQKIDAPAPQEPRDRGLRGDRGAARVLQSRRGPSARQRALRIEHAFRRGVKHQETTSKTVNVIGTSAASLPLRGKRSHTVREDPCASRTLSS